MKARTWSIICLACFLAAFWFWYLGDQKRAAAVPELVPTNTPGHTTQTAPGARVATVSLLTQLAPRQSALIARSPVAVAQAALASGTKSAADLRLTNTRRSVAELTRSDSAILLRNALIDTRSAGPLPIPAHLRAGEDPGAYLVHTRGNVTAAFRNRIEASGASVVAYLPNNALLVRATPAVASGLVRLPSADLVLPWEPYYKVSPSLLPAAIDQRSIPEEARFKLTGYPGEREALRLAVEAAGGRIEGEEDNYFGPQLVVAPPANGLVALAGLPTVQLVEPSVPRALAADLTRQRFGITADTVTPTNYLNLSGTNIWVNVNDAGVDWLQPDLVGRVFGDPSALQDVLGHGTAVAGIIAGSGLTAPGNTPSGSVSNANFRGMAPAANLVVMPVDPLYGPLPSDSFLITGAAETNYLVLGRTNALVSNNSWVYPGQYEYNSSSAAFDAATRDALPEDPGSQAMLYVFAAGNNGNGNDIGTGGDPGSIPSPGTAKNVITVGAIEALRNITNESVLTSGEVKTTNAVFLPFTDSDDEVLAVSSRGNVGIGVEGDYGRFKPDVMSPGSFLVSTRSRLWTTNSSPTNTSLGSFPNQTIPASGRNNYAVTVPATNAALLLIETRSNILSASPFPALRIEARTRPDSGTADWSGSGSLSIPNPPYGSIYYSIFNETDTEVRFDLRTRIDVPTDGEGIEVTRDELNESLGPDYRYLSGTSASAGGISGLLALVQEFFETQLKRSYTPALLKALLINGSRSLSSQYSFEVRNRINYQGWGLPFLPSVLPAGLTNADETAWPVRWVDQSPTNSLATGQEHTYALSLTTNALDSDLRITLVWTDPPGNPAAGVKLVNDLDLLVSSDSGTDYVGNDIPENSNYNRPLTKPADPLDTNAPSPPVSAGFDNVNNVENIFIRQPLATNYTIRVAARRVNVNAVTANTNAIVQDYALVISSAGGTSGFTKFEPVVSTSVSTNAQVSQMTNGVAMLNQRLGANFALVSYPQGQSNQWHFYVFTNTYVPGVSLLTNGPYVAFATFFPPNQSVPRVEESDIDLYVTRSSENPALAEQLFVLNTDSIAVAYKSLDRNGTELVTFTNALEGEIFYIGVKSEDQMASEYGFIGLSSLYPFESLDEDGNLVLTGLPVPMDIPDGSPAVPGGVSVMAIGISPVRVGNVAVDVALRHEEMGDLLGNLKHNSQFAVLNNHAINESTNGFYSATYDDGGSASSAVSVPSDGPGSLLNFLGLRNSGVWMLTMVDSALTRTGFVENFTVRVAPMQDLLLGVNGVVQANQWRYYIVDVPPDASLLKIMLTQMSGPLSVYVRREAPPTFTEYDKAALITPPGGELRIGIYDVPPLTAGTYFVGVYNPTASPVSYYIRAMLELSLPDSFRGNYVNRLPAPIVDNARTVQTNTVPDDRLVSSVQVGLRVNHSRASDLDFHLVSPQGTRLLLMENRGGPDATTLGYERIETNFYHVALTYDTNSGVAALYLNGIIKQQREVGQFTPATALDLYFGRRPATNDTAEQYLGLLDEVDLYNRALSASEILGIFKFGNAGKPQDGLVSLWTFDETGADSVGTNPAEVSGATYVGGKFGAALDFAAAGNQAVVRASSSLNVGASAGFTIDGWVNPADLSLNQPLAVWSDGTNRYGVEFGFLRGETNDPPGVLYANLVDTAGSNRFLTAPTQGLIVTNSMLTNVVYTTLTDDTNLTTTPIKFAQPQSSAGGAIFTNQFISGFETVPANKVTTVAAGSPADGWLVTSNSVQVLNAPPLAQTGTNLLVLGNGAIQRVLQTTAGQLYRLEWAQRQQPLPVSAVAWWPGQSNANDIIGANNGVVVKTVTYVPAMVGDGFQFGLNAGYISVPDSAALNLSEALTYEMWYRVDAGAVMGGGLLAKRKDPAASIPVAANYGATLAPLGLDAWFNDPDGTSLGSDDPINGFEAVRLSPPPVAGVFHHLAVTYAQVAADSVQMRLYVDGLQRRERVFTGVSLADAVNDGPLLIGSGFAETDGLNGIIDELTLYERALAPQEIAQIAAMNAAGKSPSRSSGQTRVALGGITTNTYSSFPGWITNSIVFQATTNTIVLEVVGTELGAMVDSFALQPVPQVYYLSEEPLKPWIGEPALGDWRLEITDSRTGATNPIPANLIKWQLQLTFAPNTVPATSLTNGLGYTNSLATGQAAYFIVEVPRAATRVTNSLTASRGLDLWFNQTGVPSFEVTNDFRLLTNTTAGVAVLATNGVYQVDTNGVQSTPLRATPFLEPGQRYYLGITNSGPPASYVVRVDFDALDTNILGLTTLTNNVAISTNIAVTNALQYYQYSVSAAAVEASFEVLPTNGNVSLYIRKARAVPNPLPTPRNFDYASTNSGTNAEIIRVTPASPVPLSAGMWFLGVLNVDTNVVGYSIRVVEKLRPPEEVIDLTNGVPLSASVTTNLPPAKFFRFTVTNEASAVQFDVLDLSGRGRLLAQLDARPGVQNYLVMDYGAPGAPAKLIVRTNDLLPSLVGAWYLAVVDDEAVDISFTILASFPPAVPEIKLLADGVTRVRTVAADTAGLPEAPDYYVFSVPPAATNLTITCTPRNGNADLVVRKGLPLPTLTDYDYSASAPGTTPDDIVITPGSAPIALSAGDWYIGVVNSEPTSVTYTIEARTGTGGGTVIDPVVTYDSATGAVTFGWVAAPGLSFEVQYATGIPANGPIAWIPLPPPPVTSTTAQYQFTDDGSQSGGSGGTFKIYRVVQLP